MIGLSQGTFILRRKGRYYKVLSVTHANDNWWIFKCKTLDKKDGASFGFQLSGMWEALDKACTMKNAKDILLMDLDQQGKWKIWTQDELDKLQKRKRKRKQRTKQL